MDNRDIKAEVRLRIVEVVVPQSTRLGLTEPEIIEKACLHLEKYVLGSDNKTADKPAAVTRKSTKKAGKKR